MRLGRSIAAVLLLGISLVGALQFSGIDDQKPMNWSALELKPTSDLVQLGLVEVPNISRWYSFFFALSHAAPDSHLILPADSPLDGSRFTSSAYGFGTAKLVSVKTYESRVVRIEDVLNEAGASTYESQLASGDLRQGPGRMGYDVWTLLVPDDAASGQTLITFFLMEGTEVHLLAVDKSLLKPELIPASL